MEEMQDAPLSRFTTLKIGGAAELLCNPASPDELLYLLDRLRKDERPWHVLGGGSNLLVSSHGVEGCVIRTARMIGVEQLEPDLLLAESGSRLPHLARQAADKGLSGLEFAVGIPGTVGGGVVMNAGAHGSSMSEIVEEVTVFDTTTWQIVTLKKEDLKFEYRKSAIDPNTQIVLSAKLRLKPDDGQKVLERIKHNEEYRWKTQPLGFPNAGSTFKNPLTGGVVNGVPTTGAGFLLDKAGAKVLREGQAAVSAVHANFVINMGGASSDEVTQLLQRMQDTVYNTFEIKLKPEWKRLGTFTDSEKAIWNGDQK